MKWFLLHLYKLARYFSQPFFVSASYIPSFSRALLILITILVTESGWSYEAIWKTFDIKIHSFFLLIYTVVDYYLIDAYTRRLEDKVVSASGEIYQLHRYFMSVVSPENPDSEIPSVKDKKLIIRSLIEFHLENLMMMLSSDFSDRVTLYFVDKDDKVASIVARYSDNKIYKEWAKPYFELSGTVIGRAWEKGFYKTSIFIETVGFWLSGFGLNFLDVQDIINKQGRMASRKYYAIRVGENRENIGVIVFESEKLTHLLASDIKNIMAKDTWRLLLELFKKYGREVAYETEAGEFEKLIIKVKTDIEDKVEI